MKPTDFIRKTFNLFLILLCLAPLAGCMFSGDRKIYVSGTVRDEIGHPLEGVTVRCIADAEHVTDTNGCFRFGGHFNGDRLNIRVTKPGFKPYDAYNKLNSYDISVSLVASTSNLKSKASWRVLKEDELWPEKSASFNDEGYRVFEAPVPAK
jgi:hypothetical protein